MNSVFDAYARYYDLLYSDKNYSSEAEYVVSRIREHAPQTTRILELGCGTGAHAEHLARLGYTVHGVDVSSAMVESAITRKRDLPAQIANRLSFRQGDVRTIRTGENYGAVVSLFHVVSYQATNIDIDSMFQTASDHLTHGGLFLFDFWYGPAVLTQKPEVRVKRLENDTISVTRIAEPAIQANENVVDVQYTVFVEDKASRRVEQVRETHRMRYLFLPEIDAHLAGSRLRRLSVTEWMTNEDPNLLSWAAFAVAQKVSDQCRERTNEL